MHTELEKLRKITEKLTSNGYLIDQTKEWEYAFDAVPDYVFVVNPTFIVKYANRALVERIGVKSKKDVIGIYCYQMLGFEQPVMTACKEGEDPCTDCIVEATCEDKGSDVCNFGEHVIPRLEGVFQFTRSAIKSTTGKLLGYICVLRDVTKARMVSRASKSLLDLYELEWNTDEELARFILEEIVHLTDSTVGYLHFVDDIDDDTRLDLFIWSKETMKGCNAQSTMHYPLCDAGIWADSVRERRPVLHNDYPSEMGCKGLPEGHFPIKRHMSVPIFDAGRIVAVVGVGNKILPYTELDVTHTNIALTNMWTTMQKKKLERELRRTEFSLLEVTRLTKTAIYEIDFVNDRFTYVNDAMCDHTGYTREELLEMGPTNIITESSQIKFAERLTALDRGEDVPNSVEYQARMKDGSYKWVLCSTDFRYNKSGIVIGSRVVSIDITDQREADRKVRNILEASPFGVHLYECVDGKLIFKGFNPAADRILKLDNNIYLDMELKEAFPDLDDKGVSDQYIKVMNTGETWSASIDYVDDKIGGSFEVHAFKTSDNTMAAMFKEIGMEEILQIKVVELTDKLAETEHECRMLSEYLTTKIS